MPIKPVHKMTLKQVRRKGSPKAPLDVICDIDLTRITSDLRQVNAKDKLFICCLANLSHLIFCYALSLRIRIYSSCNRVNLS